MSRRRWVLLAGIVSLIGLVAVVPWIQRRQRTLSYPWAEVPIADGFDFPVGPPDAVGYYDAQPFGENDHLGDDWNGVGGGNTDLGDPVHSVADGLVVFASDEERGWGNVVRVAHRLPDGARVESLYAHLDEIHVRVGQKLRRGEQLGTIGTAHGKYLAHLHLEIRDVPGLPLGGGYSEEVRGHVAPTRFIRAHRPAAPST